MNFGIDGSLNKIYIKRRTFEQWLVMLILFFPFAFGLLFETLALPEFIKYLIDLSVVVLAVGFIMKKRIIIKRNVMPAVMVILIFFVYTLVVYVFNFQSPFYYLWGLRNNFRFYVAFFAFTVYIDESFANSLLKIFDVLFWANIIISVVQFVLFGVLQDQLGGLFGSSGATNAYTLIFFTIIISKSLLQTFNGYEKVSLCVFKCVASLLVAAMAEMKFYFFVFIILLGLASVLTKFSRRKFVILLLSGVAVAVGAMILTYLFEEFKGFLTITGIIEAATQEHYATQTDIGRLNAIFTLAQNYITNPIQQIFGMGLGNCDLSEVEIFNSKFYQQYSYLHYTWFSSAITFLENGFIGMAIYLSFFVVCLKNAASQLKRKVGNKLFCQLAVMVSLMCFVLFFYNSTLRIEAAYMPYFVLALPFLENNTTENKTLSYKSSAQTV